MAIKSGSGRASLILANETRSGLRDREGNGQLLPGEMRRVGAVLRTGRTRTGGTGTGTTGRGRSRLRGRATRPQNYGIEDRETHGNRASYRGACLDTTPRSKSAEQAAPGFHDRVKVASPAVKDPGQSARSERVSRAARPS